MASPGWYADPSGQPNRFRFWDGQSWSQETTADPYNTPPPGQQPPAQQPPAQGQAPGQGQPQQPGGQFQQPQQPPQQPGWPQANQGYAGGAAGGQGFAGEPASNQSQAWSPTPGDGASGGKSGKKMWIAVVGVVLAILLIVGGIFGAMALTGGDDDKDDDAGGDESSQTTDPSESGSESESSDPESESSDPESESADPDADARPTVGKECTAGSPLKGKSKNAKGRVVGGGLSFVKPKGYKGMKFEKVFTFASDVSVVGREIETYWASTMAVGQLRVADYKTPKEAADGILNCMAASDQFYSGFQSRNDLISETGSVNKKPGWRIKSEIRIKDPRIKAEGDIAEVIVVKLDKKRYGAFIGVVPIGDSTLAQVLDKAVGTLHVE